MLLVSLSIDMLLWSMVALGSISSWVPVRVLSRGGGLGGLCGCGLRRFEMNFSLFYAFFAGLWHKEGDIMIVTPGVRGSQGF